MFSLGGQELSQLAAKGDPDDALLKVTGRASIRCQPFQTQLSVAVQEKLMIRAANSMLRQLTSGEWVYVIDDESASRRHVARLVRSVDLSVEQFSTATEFLAVCPPSVPACIVLDVRLPGMTGLELQVELLHRNILTPIIFISEFAEVTNATTAMRAGAVDFLSKPFSPHQLLERIHEALKVDHEQNLRLQMQSEVEARIATLTEREQEVMKFLARGETTKELASRLGISPKTVDNHRARVFQKMGVDNAAQLACLTLTLNPNQQGACRQRERIDNGRAGFLLIDKCS